MTQTPDTTERQLTKDEIYDTVQSGDFASLIEVDRYNKRTSAFDKIISATHDHFWDPLDARYIDFNEPFDMENESARRPQNGDGGADGCVGQAR